MKNQFLSKSCSDIDKKNSKSEDGHDILVKYRYIPALYVLYFGLYYFGQAVTLHGLAKILHPILPNGKMDAESCWQVNVIAKETYV